MHSGALKSILKVKKKNLRLIIASQGTRVRESVFKIKFKVLAGEFKSIALIPLQDLPGFQMKIEFKDIKNQQCFEKNVKQQKSRTEHCDFTKKFKASIFDKKNDCKQRVNENSQN